MSLVLVLFLQTRSEDEIFNEVLHPINNDKVDSKKVPTFDLVFDFLNSIYRAERLAPECLVMCLAYIDRMLQSTPIRMHASNWRRLILSSLILASKVWEVKMHKKRGKKNSNLPKQKRVRLLFVLFRFVLQTVLFSFLCCRSGCLERGLPVDLPPRFCARSQQSGAQVFGGAELQCGDESERIREILL
jgi:hypothetical protein